MAAVETITLFKQVGKNLNVVVTKSRKSRTITRTGTSEELAPIKANLKKYEALKDKTTRVAVGLYNRIIKDMQPKEEKKKEELAVAELKVKTQKKVIKKEIKADLINRKDEVKAKKITSLEITKFLPKGLFEVRKDGEIIKRGFDIAIPQLLIAKMLEFGKRKIDITPLLNFWDLCMLNPNAEARDKFFDYLSHHNLIITPAGYVVTYRMVKKTSRKTQDGRPIYTSARTGNEDYIIGETFSLNREKCDGNGTRDCSSGLHTGSPEFIGIKIMEEGKEGVGDGYGIKYVTTKAAHPNSYGTGYDRPRADTSTTQEFDNTFGNQAVICLVNPMHVVSIPYSDTRKMRSCELYFAKETTPEEVISHLNEDYFVFDNDYRRIEQEQITNMLKEAKLIDIIKGGATVTRSKAKLAELEVQLKKARLNSDPISVHLDLSQVKSIIQGRMVKLKARK